MESRFGRLGEFGDVITADMIRGRLLQIASMAGPGEFISAVVVELEYLTDTLRMTHSVTPPAP